MWVSVGGWGGGGSMSLRVWAEGVGGLCLSVCGRRGVYVSPCDECVVFVVVVVWFVGCCCFCCYSRNFKYCLILGMFHILLCV